jgi:hypothetical protein
MNDEVVEPGGNDVGKFCSLALDAQDNPHISCYDATEGFRNLLYIRQSDGEWQSAETVHANANDTGKYSSLVLDDQDNPHIGFYDGTYGNLLYIRKWGGVWQPVETADDSSDDVGRYASLAFDDRGEPFITYHNSVDGDVWCAYRHLASSVTTQGTVSPDLAIYPNPFGNEGTRVAFRIPEGDVLEFL